MNAILVIILTGFAVLGAYFLADLLTGGAAAQDTGPALLVICTPLSAPDAAQISQAVRELLPRCELLCVPADEQQLLPADCMGYQGIHFAPQERIAHEAASWLHLQTGEKSV